MADILYSPVHPEFPIHEHVDCECIPDHQCEGHIQITAMTDGSVSVLYHVPTDPPHPNGIVTDLRNFLVALKGLSRKILWAKQRRGE